MVANSADAQVDWSFGCTASLELRDHLTPHPHPPSFETGTRVGSSCDRLSRRNCRETESFQNVLHLV